MISFMMAHPYLFTGQLVITLISLIACISGISSAIANKHPKVNGDIHHHYHYPNAEEVQK